MSIDDEYEVVYVGPSAPKVERVAAPEFSLVERIEQIFEVIVHPGIDVDVAWPVRRQRPGKAATVLAIPASLLR
jgi:hypothetical protein